MQFDFRKPQPPTEDKRWKLVNATMRRNGGRSDALIESLHAVAIPGADASFSAEEMAGIASEQGIRTVESTSVEAAVQDIVRADREPKRIVICGSLYLAGKVLEANS